MPIFVMLAKRILSVPFGMTGLCLIQRRRAIITMEHYMYLTPPGLECSWMIGWRNFREESRGSSREYSTVWAEKGTSSIGLMIVGILDTSIGLCAPLLLDYTGCPIEAVE